MPKKKTIDKELLVLEYVKTKSERLKEQIIIAYQPLIDYIARKFTFKEDDFLDLSQVGSIGLLKSLENFDSSKNNTFATYASSHIIGEIRHYLRDKVRLVKIPRRIQEKNSKIQKYIKYSTQVLGHPPTVKDISMALNFEEEEIIETMDTLNKINIVSLDKPFFEGNKSSQSEKTSLLDQLDVSPKQDSFLDKEIINEALDQLPLRLQKIIYLKFHEGLTQRDIANRLQLSQVHISRLLKEAIDTLKSLLMYND